MPEDTNIPGSAGPRPTLRGVRIRRTVLDAVAAHARREYPRECCGLLVGDSGHVVEAVPTANVADDPLRRYEVSPAEHVALIRHCRERSPHGPPVGVIGAYHSHPRSEAHPSPTDLDLACREFLFLIAGPVGDATEIVIRGYRRIGAAFEEVALVVT